MTNLHKATASVVREPENNKIPGVILKGIGGFYYVASGEGLYECKARGIFKKQGRVPMVGDRVVIEPLQAQPSKTAMDCVGTALIWDIELRKNSFIRPPVANVDCFILVFAGADPDPNPSLMDRFLVMAEKHHTQVIICISKKDIAKSSSIKRLKEVYEPLYPFVTINGLTGEGIDDLKALMINQTYALAGPSGVGKSTILNFLMNSMDMEVGQVSEKTGRGRHTTRHSQLFQTPFGPMIFDTPGFTSFEVLEANEEELHFLYPEMEALVGDCKYDNCRHLHEPRCAVVESVNKGEIAKSRYNSYCQQMAEIREREQGKY